jgi:hypothetical protein
MLSNIIWKNKNKSNNVNERVYFYVHNIIEFVLSFHIVLIFNFIITKNYLKFKKK